MRRNRRNNAKKERIIMIASSAFVLAALTMTGIYMKSNEDKQLDDGYTIDFTALEENINNKMDEIEQGSQELAQNGQNSQGSTFGDGRENDLSGISNMDNDLDYLPMEAGSGQIEIPGLTDRFREEETIGGNSSVGGNNIINQGTPSEGNISGMDNTPLMGDTPSMENIPLTEDTPSVETAPVVDNTPIIGEEPVNPEANAPVAPDTEEQIQDADNSNVAVDTLHFSENDGLLRPVSGEVLIPYSMNGTVYFSTLDQFKYNSALVLEAELGSPVMACADARVIDIFENEEIGQAVTMELGDGYRITYGQLEALNVKVGHHVEAGEVIGWIAKPTKYYCVEGSNLYLKLTADGKPVNPEALFR